MKDIHYLPTYPDTTGQLARHQQAVGWKLPMAQAVDAWCRYANAHLVKHGSPIGEDYFLGPAWAQWGQALMRLLNGDIGQLDTGTLDTIIGDNLEEQGFDRYSGRKG